MPDPVRANLEGDRYRITLIRGLHDHGSWNYAVSFWLNKAGEAHCDSSVEGVYTELLLSPGEKLEKFIDSWDAHPEVIMVRLSFSKSNPADLVVAALIGIGQNYGTYLLFDGIRAVIGLDDNGIPTTRLGGQDIMSSGREATMSPQPLTVTVVTPQQTAMAAPVINAALAANANLARASGNVVSALERLKNVARLNAAAHRTSAALTSLVEAAKDAGKGRP